MISAVMIFTENGFLLYSLLAEKDVDPVSFSGFLSALKSFARSNLVTGDLRGIQIGKSFLNFFNLNFEHFGSLDVMILSENLDPASSFALCTLIGEKFALYLDEKYLERPEIIKEINRGKNPNFRDFDQIIMPLILECEMQEGSCIESKVFIPNRVFDTINHLFNNKPEIAEEYNHNPNFLIEQFLSEYSRDELDERIKEKFALALNGFNGVSKPGEKKLI